VGARVKGEENMDVTLKVFLFLYPGFLSIFVLTFLIRDIDWKRDLLGALVYSVLTDSIADFLLSVLKLPFLEKHRFLLLTIIAFILAILTIWLLSLGFIRRVLIRTRNDLFMTAWDAAWKKMSLESPVICEVYLKDEKFPIVGVFSAESVVSFSNRKDGIYLEKLLIPDENFTKAKIDESSLGIFIPHDEIKLIKFYKLREGDIN
jgi:hypothetical protein